MNDIEKKARIKKVVGVTALLISLCVLIYVIHVPCIIHEKSGIYCAACGTQRMLDKIFKLDFSGAFRENVFMFFSLPLAGIIMIISAARYIKGKPPLMASRGFKIFLFIFIVVSVVFMVLRNMPQFSFLAPI